MYMCNRNAWVRFHHCCYWCPVTKAPGHRYHKCWLNIELLNLFLTKKYCIYGEQHWKMKSNINKKWSSCFRPLQWRHNDRDGVSNHQHHHCLFNRLFRHRSKKTSKLRVTGLCVGNSPVTGEFTAQMASNAENVSIRWRHHAWPPGYMSHPNAAFPVLHLQWMLTHCPPGLLSKNVRETIFKLILVIDDWCASCEITLRRMSSDLTDDKATLVQVMAWCRRAPSHYLNQCWPRSVLRDGVTTHNESMNNRISTTFFLQDFFQT